jgi:hypothetical protein
MSQAPKLPRKKPILEAEFISSENGHLINQTIVQILVEKGDPAEIEKLMQAELNFNRERLSILREHTELHPDAIEDRRSKRFRRIQYLFLMALLPPLLGVIYFSQMAVSIALCSMAMLIVVGVVLNGRDRDNDSEVLVKLIEKILRAEQ